MRGVGERQEDGAFTSYPGSAKQRSSEDLRAARDWVVKTSILIKQAIGHKQTKGQRGEKFCAIT